MPAPCCIHPRRLYTHHPRLLVVVVPKDGASTPFSLQVVSSLEQTPLQFSQPLTLAGDRDSRRIGPLTLRNAKLLREVENNPELATAAEGRDKRSLCWSTPSQRTPWLLGKHPGPITHLAPQSLGSLFRGDVAVRSFWSCLRQA